MCVCVFFQAEDGIRDLVRSRGLGDVYKRQGSDCSKAGTRDAGRFGPAASIVHLRKIAEAVRSACLLYTSDAADERSSVDLGGRRIIKKKKQQKNDTHPSIINHKLAKNQTQIK